MSAADVADHPCPECRTGKHDNCDGSSWLYDADRIAACPCWVANHCLPKTSPAETAPTVSDAGSEDPVEPGAVPPSAVPGSGSRPGELLADFSAWITLSYPRGLSNEAIMWRRLVKVAEESGEVIRAYGGSIGENPRKGVTHEPGDVDKELLDTALAALGAYEHRQGYDGSSLYALVEHLNATRHRAGLTEPR